MRIDDQAFRNGKLIGVLVQHRWHKYSVTTTESGTVERTLTPLEPRISESDGRDLEDCVRAKPPVKPRDPLAERIAWIDAHFPRKAMRR